MLRINVLQNIKGLLLVLSLLASQGAWAKKGEVHRAKEGCEAHIHFEEEEFFFCDTCGCGASGGSMGYSTGMNNNFFGIRYINQAYRSKEGIFNDSPWVNENFNTLQAWGQIPIQRFLVNVLVPYQFHNRDFPDGTTQKINGLGDITLLGYYNLIKPTPDSIVTITPEHFLQVGGGIKMPTGEYRAINNAGSVNPSFQVGTGSWDYILGLNYGFTYRNWGISTLFNYAFKTENSQEYQFGDQFNAALNVFKTYYVGQEWSFTPSLGVVAERYGKDTEFGIELPGTKGSVFLGKVGVEANYSRFALGLVGMLPMAQDLTDGNVELKNRFSLYVNINI